MLTLGRNELFNSLSFCKGELSGVSVNQGAVYYFPNISGIQQRDKDIVLSDGKYIYEPIVNSLNGTPQLGFFKRLWKGVKRVAKKVGRFVKKTAKKVVKGIKKAGKFIYKKVLPVVKKVVKTVAPILSFVPGPIGWIATAADVLVGFIPDPKNPSRKIPVKKKVTKMVKGRKVAFTGRSAKLSKTVYQKKLTNQHLLEEQQKQLLQQQVLSATKQLSLLDKEVKTISKSKNIDLSELLSLVLASNKKGISYESLLKNVKAATPSVKDIERYTNNSAKTEALKVVAKGIDKNEFQKLAQLHAQLEVNNTAQKEDIQLYSSLISQSKNKGKSSLEDVKREVQWEQRKRNQLSLKQAQQLSKTEALIQKDKTVSKQETKDIVSKSVQLAKLEAQIKEQQKLTNKQNTDQLMITGAIGLITLIISSNS